MEPQSSPKTEKVTESAKRPFEPPLIFTTEGTWALSSFPVEIWVKLLSQLFSKTLRALCLVNKHFYTTIHGDTRMLQKIRRGVIDWNRIIEHVTEEPGEEPLLFGKQTWYSDEPMATVEADSTKKYLALTKAAKNENWSIVQHTSAMRESGASVPELFAKIWPAEDEDFVGMQRTVWESDNGHVLYLTLTQNGEEGAIGLDNKTDGLVVSIAGAHPTVLCCDFQYYNSDGSGPSLWSKAIETWPISSADLVLDELWINFDRFTRDEYH